MGIADDPFCGCTIIDKDHEATEGVSDRKLRFTVFKGKNIIFLTYE
jgi:hypothetical protein